MLNDILTAQKANDAKGPLTVVMGITVYRCLLFWKKVAQMLPSSYTNSLLVSFFTILHSSFYFKGYTALFWAKIVFFY